MKSIQEYIVEKMIYTKNNSIQKYNYHPKTKEELQDIITKLIEERGNEGDFNDIDTSKITDMSKLFRSMEKIHGDFNGDISKWDVSNVENMELMFGNCTSFNCDISNWDVSKVENMYNMFSFCRSFNKPLNDWDVSNVENMNYMFYACNSFNQPLNKWDVSKVTSMAWMFAYCKVFNQDLSKWNVSNVESNTFMFDECPIKIIYEPKFK